GPGLVLALLCMAIVEPESRATAARPSILASARELLLIPAYRNVVLGYCAFTFAMGGFAYWAPKYLTARYAMADGRASMLFGAVTVVGGLVGTLVGGWLGDRWTKGRSDDPAVTRASLLVCAVSAALGAPLALAAILSPQALWFFVLVVPCEVGLFLSSGPVNAAILRSVPGGLRASAMALSIFGIHMLGDLWSPP